jgi:uncharacterized protein YjbI with pentapeptide repeats
MGKISKEKFKDVLAKHNKWLESGGLEGKQAELINADFRKLDYPLEGINLSGAYLKRCIFNDRNLKKIILSHFEEKKKGNTNIVHRTELQGAQFEGTNLKGANLSNADLEGAVLQGADLHGAELNGAILKGAINLTQKQIDSAIIDENTVLPSCLE